MSAMELLMVIVKVLVGATFGSLVAVVIKYLCRKSLINELRSSGLSALEDDLDVRYRMTIKGDMIGDAMRDIEYGYMIGDGVCDDVVSYVAIMVIGTVGFSFLGLAGVIALGVGCSVCNLVSPRIGEYFYTISCIEDVIKQVHPGVDNARKASKEIYKALKLWLRPGRDYEEFCIAVNTFMEYYLSKYGEPETLALPCLEP